MKQYNYLLWDWDGNIAKTLDIWLDAMRAVLAEEGYHPSDEEIAGTFGKIEDYLKELGFSDPKAVYSRIDMRGREQLPSAELYPGALEVLRHYQAQGKKIALITASNYQNVAETLARYEMRPLFDVIVAHEDVTKHKPDPEPLHIALEKLGGTPREAVMIGDSDKDMGAALNAGTDSILFYPPEHTKYYSLEKLKQLQPTHVISDFTQIKTIIK